MAGKTGNAAFELVALIAGDAELERSVEIAPLPRAGGRPLKPISAEEEAYCQMRGRGMGKRESYINAGLVGNKSLDANLTKYATDLEKRANIAARIQEIRDERTAQILSNETITAPEDDEGRIAITSDWVVRQLLQTLAEAREAQNAAVTLKTVEKLGQTIGMFMETKVDGRKDRSKPNEGQTSTNAALPRKSFDIQELHQLLDGSDDAAGDIPAPQDVASGTGTAHEVGAERAVERPRADLSLLDRFAGEISKGVRDGAEG